MEISFNTIWLRQVCPMASCEKRLICPPFTLTSAIRLQKCVCVCHFITCCCDEMKCVWGLSRWWGRGHGITTTPQHLCAPLQLPKLHKRRLRIIVRIIKRWMSLPCTIPKLWLGGDKTSLADYKGMIMPWCPML